MFVSIHNGERAMDQQTLDAITIRYHTDAIFYNKVNRAVSCAQNNAYGAELHPNLDFARKAVAIALHLEEVDNGS
jgi:hypothetical protein